MMMRLSSLLAVVSSLLLLALAAELYYLFCCKKRSSSSLPSSSCDSCNPKLNLSYIMTFCFPKTSTPIAMIPVGAGAAPPPPATSADQPPHPCLNAPAKDGDVEEQQIDAELMRLHSLAGPPRFLFTIKEETREDLLLLEADDRRSRRRSRLGDLLHCADSPFMTPLPLLHIHSSESESESESKSLGLGLGVGVHFETLKKLGFNPLFESTTAAAYSHQSHSGSPPPKLKFLKEAEEKLQRNIMMCETVVAMEEEASGLQVQVQATTKHYYSSSTAFCGSALVPCLDS